MDFVPVRQYHGALLARGFYQWLQSGAMRTLPPDGVLEPPILELISSAGYVLLGKEHLWLPRALSALFWTGGGAFVYLTARRLFSMGAALISTALYLFLPYGILAGRAFMPDPLMVMLLCSSVYAVLLRYHEEPSTRRLLLASAVSALAVFVKPGIAAFQIFGAFAAISVYKQGLKKSLADPRYFLFAALTVLPTALYYLYGTYLAGFLEGEMQEKVIPGYLLEPTYWQGWLYCVKTVVGYVAFILGLLGVFLCRSASARALLFGLWGGYLAFGLIFTYHIHTHEYYSLQLIPVVALSLGALWDAAAGRFWWAPSWVRAVFLVVCLLVVAAGLAEHRNTIRDTAYALGGEDSERASKDSLPADYEARARTYRQIGKAINNSSRTVFAAPDFGLPLDYHGRIDGEYWPDPGMWGWWEFNGRAPNSDRWHYWAELRSEHSPEYFVVIKRPAGPEQPSWREDELLVAITEGYPMVAHDDAYVVFDLSRGRVSG